MKNLSYRVLVVVLVISAASSTQLIGTQRAPAASQATLRAVAAAKAFLSTLDDRQRSVVVVPLNKENRAKWHNFPNGILPFGERNGIKLGDLTPPQQDAAMKLVAAALSPMGYQKVLNIVNGDDVFNQSERRAPTAPVRFGRGEYHVAILGAPSETAPWMIQFGGHHLGLNITLVGAQDVLTPSHTGAQPATYSLNGETIRPLGKETDQGFALVNSLDATQQKQAILNYQVVDVVLGPGHDGETIQPEGVRASTFNAKQQAMLLSLIEQWVDIINASDAKPRMAEIKASLPDTYFAWSGSTAVGSPSYFRIQGPTVEIEYAPQCLNPPCDAHKPDANHIHTFYRDPTNDYGARLFKP